MDPTGVWELLSHRTINCHSPQTFQRSEKQEKNCWPLFGAPCVGWKQYSIDFFEAFWAPPELET